MTSPHRPTPTTPRGLHLSAAAPWLPADPAADATASPRRFAGVAYSGAVLRPGWGALVIDLASVQLPPSCPVLESHDRDRRVGIATLAVRDGALVADGRLLSNPRAEAIAAEADQGFPWQLSVHAEAAGVQELAAGATATVNGRAVTGPLSIWQGVAIRELSFTPTGVDAHTHAEVLHLSPHDEAPTMAESAPTPAPDLTAQLAALTTRAETAEAQLAAAPPATLITELQTQVAALTAALAGQARERLLAAAVADGRLPPGGKLYAYAQTLAAEPLAALLADLPPVAALTATQTAGLVPAGVDGFSAALQEEFGDEATYRAYQAAERAGRVKLSRQLTSEG